MLASCPQHGTQPIVSMGADAVRLACGGVGSDGHFQHESATKVVERTSLYTLVRILRGRYQVLHPETAEVLGSVRGDVAIGFDACLPGGRKVSVHDSPQAAAEALALAASYWAPPASHRQTELPLQGA